MTDISKDIAFIEKYGVKGCLFMNCASKCWANSGMRMVLSVFEHFIYNESIRNIVTFICKKPSSECPINKVLKCINLTSSYARNDGKIITFNTWEDGKTADPIILCGELSKYGFKYNSVVNNLTTRNKDKFRIYYNKYETTYITDRQVIIMSIANTNNLRTRVQDQPSNEDIHTGNINEQLKINVTIDTDEVQIRRIKSSIQLGKYVYDYMSNPIDQRDKTGKVILGNVSYTGDLIYEPVCYVMYYGDGGSGHYYVLMKIKDTWYKMNDVGYGEDRDNGYYPKVELKEELQKDFNPQVYSKKIIYICYSLKEKN